MAKKRKNKIVISPAGLLDFENAARYLGGAATLRTMQRLRRTKRLLFQRIGRRLMIHIDDLNRFARGESQQ